MKTVADAVLQLIQHDEVALESFRSDFLNLSAYAKKIHPSVEKITYKNVKPGTIIVALSRLSKTDLKVSDKPNLVINHLSSRSPVTSFTYPKTSDIERRVSTLNPYILGSNDLFGIIEGEGEIVIIASEKAEELIKDHIGAIPKQEISDLVAVTVQFSGGTNALQLLLSVLSMHKIKVVNVLPTLNETAFILDKNDLEQAISALNLYMNKEEKYG